MRSKRIFESLFFICVCLLSLQHCQSDLTTLWSDITAALFGSNETTTETLDEKSQDTLVKKFGLQERRRVNLNHNKLIEQFMHSHFPSRVRRAQPLKRLHDTGVHQLTGIVPLTTVCPSTFYIRTIDFHGYVVTACISIDRQMIIVGRINENNKWSFMLHLSAIDAQELVMFTDETLLYILVADRGKEMGIDLTRIDRNFHLMPKEHIVNCHRPTAIALWKTTFDNKWHLAVANSPRLEKNQKILRSTTSTYTWLKTYFDHYDDLSSFYVKDLCPFTIHNTQYIAVINNKAGFRQHAVDSEIFQLDLDKKGWKSIQRIRSFAANDGEFFTLGTNALYQEHFLVIANEFEIVAGRKKFEIESVIYKFSIDKFVPFQCLKTVGAKQITTYQGKQGEFVMAVATITGVRLYQYNGWRFVESPIQYSSHAMGPGVSSLFTSHLGKRPVLVIGNARKGHEANIFEFRFMYSDLFGEWYNHTLRWCRDSLLNSNMKSIDDLSSAMNDVFFINQEKPILIKNTLIVKDIITDVLVAPLIYDKSIKFRFSHTIIDELRKIELILKRLDMDLNSMKNLLSSALYLNGDQVIQQPFAIKSVNFKCTAGDSCGFRSINVDVINGIPVKNLKNEVIQLDADQSIRETLHFQQLDVIDIYVGGLIDGIKSNDFVSTTGNHMINNAIILKNIVSRQVNASHLVNGRIINRDEILLTTGDQMVESPLTLIKTPKFQNAHINMINGHRLDDYLRNFITVDGKHLIRDLKHFDHINVNRLHLMPRSLVNNFDLLDHWYNQLWISGNQIVKARMHFGKIIISGNLQVDGDVNGIRLPNPLIILTNQSALITAPKEFLSPTAIRKAKATFLNGINFDGQMKILLKNRPQTAYIPMKFNTIYLRKHSSVGGTVDGIKLKSLLKRSLLRNVSHVLQGTVVVDGNVIFENKVKIEGKIDNLQIENIYNRALKLSDREIPPFHMNFDHIDADTLKSSAINGLNIGRDLMTTNTRQVIVGPKVFTAGIHLQRDFTVHKLNNLVLTLIHESLHTIGNQIINGHKVVEGDIFVDNLFTPSLNDIDMNDVVLLNQPQEIMSVKNFSSIVVRKDVFSNQVYNIKRINNIDFNDFIYNTLRYDDYQVISGMKAFNFLKVPLNSSIKANTINGVNVNQVYKSAIFIHRPSQIISGFMTFKAPVSVERLSVSGLLDTISLAEIQHNWLIQGLNQTIHGNVIVLHNALVAGNLFTTVGKINGINVNHLKSSVVDITKSVVINGPIKFLNVVKTEGDIRLIGRISGVDLSEEALRKRIPDIQRITGSKRFQRNLIILNHLETKGFVDGVLIPELCTNAVRRYGDQRIIAPLTVVGNLSFDSSLSINGRVNHINLFDLKESSALRNYTNTFSGVKNFDTLIIESNVFSRLLNDINWNHLAQVYLSLSRPQIITAPLIFTTGLKVANMMQINKNFFTRGLINNVDVQNLDRHALKNFGYQRIKGNYVFNHHAHFNKDLIIKADTLNGIKLHGDIMMRRGHNEITAPKVFLNGIEVKGNLDVLRNRTINGIDFSRLFKATVFRYGNQVIHGLKHLNSLQIDSLFSKGLINGIEFNERNLLLASKPQIIKGVSLFMNGITVIGHVNVHGLINNANLVEFFHNLVLKGFNNTIIGEKTFASPIAAKNIISLAKINGINIRKAFELLQKPIDFNSRKRKLMFQKEKMEAIDLMLKAGAGEFDFYDIVDYIHGRRVLPFGGKTSIRKVFFLSSPSKDYGCDDIEVLNFLNGHYMISQTLRGYKPIKVVEFVRNGKLYLLIVNGRFTGKENIAKCFNSDPSLLPPFKNGESFSQIFTFNEMQKKFVPFSFIISDAVTDVDIISNTVDSTCFAFAIPYSNNRAGTPSIYCMDNRSKLTMTKLATDFRGINRITTLTSSYFNITMLSAICSRNISLEAFKVKLFEWSVIERRFVRWIQTIKAVSPRVSHFAEAKREGPFTFLFISEGKVKSLRNEALLRIFRYTRGMKFAFIEIQQIREDVRGIETIYMPDGSLMLLLLTDNQLKLYKLNGASGFTFFDKIYTQGADMFTVNARLDREFVAGHHIAFSEKSYRSFILASKMKGFHYML